MMRARAEGMSSFYVSIFTILNHLTKKRGGEKGGGKGRPGGGIIGSR